MTAKRLHSKNDRNTSIQSKEDNAITLQESTGKTNDSKMHSHSELVTNGADNIREEALEKIQNMYGISISEKAIRQMRMHHSVYHNNMGKIKCIYLPTFDNFDVRWEYEKKGIEQEISLLLPSIHTFSNSSKGTCIGDIENSDTVILVDTLQDMFTMIDNGYTNGVIIVARKKKYPKQHRDKFLGKVIYIAINDSTIANKYARWLFGVANEIRICKSKKVENKSNSKYSKPTSAYFNQQSPDDIKKILDGARKYKCTLDIRENRKIISELNSNMDKYEHVCVMCSNCGTFLKCIYGAVTEYYWLNRETGAIYLINDKSNSIQRFIDHHFGINPASKLFRFLIEHLKTVAEVNGRLTELRRFAHYDPDKYKVYVYNNSGEVFVVNDQGVCVADNGVDGVCFLDYGYEPIKYLGASNPSDAESCIEKNLFGIIRYHSDGKVNSLTQHEQGLLFKYWFFSLFFEPLFRSKVLLLLKGAKGSGKSMVFKLVLELLFGKNEDVGGMLDKADDLFTALKNNTLLVIDNTDKAMNEDFFDMIARISTGFKQQKRALFSNGETYSFIPKCFIAATTRTNPFCRTDVVDRSLVLNIEQIKDGNYSTATHLYSVIRKNKDIIWTEILHELVNICKLLKKHYAIENQKNTISRMGEYEVFSRILARNDIFEEKEFEKTINKMRYSQAIDSVYNNYFFSFVDEYAKEHGGEMYFCLPRDKLHEIFIMYLRNELDVDVKNARLPTSRGFTQYLKNHKSDYDKLFDVHEISDRVSSGKKTLIALFYIVDRNAKMSKEQKRIKNIVQNAFASNREIEINEYDKEARNEKE